MDGEQEKTERAFRRLFAGDDGRTVLEHLEKFARFYDSVHIHDPGLAAFVNGRRSVICEIRRLADGK